MFTHEQIEYAKLNLTPQVLGSDYEDTVFDVNESNTKIICKEQSGIIKAVVTFTVNYSSKIHISEIMYKNEPYDIEKNYDDYIGDLHCSNLTEEKKIDTLFKIVSSNNEPKETLVVFLKILTFALDLPDETNKEAYMQWYKENMFML